MRKKATSSDSSPKVSSISRRFSYTLISIVTLLLVVFTTIVILFNINRIEKAPEVQELNSKVESEHIISGEPIFLAEITT